MFVRAYVCLIHVCLHARKIYVQRDRERERERARERESERERERAELSDNIQAPAAGTLDK